MNAISQIQDVWRSLPPDVKQAIQQRALLLWHMRHSGYSRFVAALHAVFAQNPAAWRNALLSNRAGTIHQLALRAGRLARLPAKGTQPGFGNTQVRQYHRRQQGRGIMPGRNRQIGIYRELELEVDRASRDLEQPESFFTKVTKIPGLGNKEGHEILTRLAMSGLAMSAPEKAAVELGVIRPDRGGASYWNFPASALESLKAAAQPSHALRPTPGSSVALALRLIHARFFTLYTRAMRATSRATALEWLGEALHLLQDSFSAAHVLRAGGTGGIRRIRAFFIRLGWPPRSTQPDEHNAPTDQRDDIYESGTLRKEARAAVLASQAFLVMALRHLRTPGAPSNAAELRAFMSRYLSP